MVSNSCLIIVLSFLITPQFSSAQYGMPLKPTYPTPYSAPPNPFGASPNPYGASPNPYGTAPVAEVAGDALTEYQQRYGVMPPSNPPPAQAAATSTEAHAEEATPAPAAAVTPEQAEAEIAAASAITPTSAVEMKKVIATQQNELFKIQNQVAELLKELKQERENVEQEKAAAAAAGTKNALNLSIQFPETAAKGGAVPSTSPKKQSPEELAKETEKKTEEELKVSGPIPVLVYTPEPMQDMQELAQQVIQQEMSANAIKAEEAHVPPTMEMKTPEERASDAIANIDKLEADKAEVETEMRIMKKQLYSPLMGAPMGLPMGPPMGLPMGPPMRI